MRLQIANWEKYNPRNDAKHWSWWRFQNDFFDDENLFDLPGPHLLLFVYICCRRSKATSRIFEINLRHAAAKARTTEDDAQIAIRALAERGILVIHPDKPDELSRTDPYADELSRTDPFPTDGRTDEDGRTDGSGISPLVLVDLWNAKRDQSQPKVNVALFRRGTPRWKSAEARLTEQPNLALWTEVVERIAASSFCRGENDRRWKADFEFLVRPETAAKVLEGKYDDRDRVLKLKPAKVIPVFTEADLEHLD